MKSLKIYLIVVCALLAIAIGFGVYVWYTIQKYNTFLEENSTQKGEQKSVQTTREVPQTAEAR